MASTETEGVCAGCGVTGADVAVRRSKGGQRLCAACFAAALESRVRSALAHRFSRALRPWSQHTVLVGVSGSARSLALLAVLARAFPAAQAHAFRIQPVFVRFNCEQEDDEATTTRMREACSRVAPDAQPLVTVDALPSPQLVAQWSELPEDVRAVLWPTAVAAGLARVAAATERVLCVTTAETAETLAARCLALTATARGGAAGGVVAPGGVLGAVPLLRVLADLRDAEAADYAAARGVGCGVDGVARGSDGGRVLAVCRAFCTDLGAQHAHTPFAVVRTAARLVPPPSAVPCALCGAPTPLEQQEEGQEERHPLLCDACVRMCKSADPSTSELLTLFMQCVTPPRLFSISDVHG